MTNTVSSRGTRDPLWLRRDSFPIKIGIGMTNKCHPEERGIRCRLGGIPPAFIVFEGDSSFLGMTGEVGQTVCHPEARGIRCCYGGIPPAFIVFGGIPRSSE